MIEEIKQKLKNAFSEINSEDFGGGYLLKGDVSGIQEFIFNVASKGAAKSLKARSYYVQVVAELCEQYCLSQLNDATSFYNGGGNFYIEIPENNFDEQQVTELQSAIDKELQYDEIYISLSWVKVSEFADFREAWDALRKKANWNKLQKFRNSHKELFNIFSFNLTEQEKDNKGWGKIVTQIYEELISETDQLVKNKKFETTLFGISYRKSFEESGKILDKLPKWESNFHEDWNDWKPETIEIRPKPNTLIDFDYIAKFAKKRTGTEKLGILKMDVDNLGSLFGSTDDFTILKKLSKSFKLFFEEIVYELWKGIFKTPSGDEIKYCYNIYPVFTGGDDCFFVGAWDAILHFAYDIHVLFTNFVKTLKENEFKLNIKTDITLSAGIVVVDNKHPVVQFSELAEDALSKAKMRKVDSDVVKNAIFIFNETLSWDDFKKAKELVSTLYDFIINRDESRAILNRIANSAKGFESSLRDANQNRLSIPKVWRLKYYLRNVKKENILDFEKEIIDKYIKALLNAFMKNGTTNPMLFPIAARWTEFLTRDNYKYDYTKQR